MPIGEKMLFSDLNVRPEIVRALKEQGIVEPTVIQEQAIPIAVQGKDLIGMSRTGSGKTVAFGVPVLEAVVPGKGLQALIMAPTRELAVQIGQELAKFCKYVPRRIATVYGGVSLEPQIREMARADLVVGTPGRLADHLERRNLDLTRLKIFVLDEADKMVEMGFIEDIERLLKASHQDRQIILFGATLSSEIDYLKKKYMDEPMLAEAEPHVQQELLKQFYYNVDAREKFSLLVHFLRKEKTEKVIIFCSKRSTVEILTKNLRAQGIKAEMIHGKMSQNKRLQVIEHFNTGKQDILVASSVAARGLDIKFVSHVFNYDLANDAQEYVHRVGRTARAGESGIAITLLSPQDHDSFRQILNRYHFPVEELPVEQFEHLRFIARMEPQDEMGRRGGYHQRHGGFSRREEHRSSPGREGQHSHSYRGHGSGRSGSSGSYHAHARR